MNVEFDVTDQVDQTGAQTYFGVLLLGTRNVALPEKLGCSQKAIAYGGWNSRDYLRGRLWQPSWSGVWHAFCPCGFDRHQYYRGGL